jgi:hypothetical protein
MGRRENPLEESSPAVAQVAQGLRDLREAAGWPPYRVLARLCGYCASALSQAASGNSLPSLEITLAFVRACGGDVEQWRERWHRAAQLLAGVTGEADPAAAVDVVSFAAELTALVHRAGFRALRPAVAASKRDPASMLSRTTLGRALRGEVLPTEEVLRRVLRLCAIPAEQQTTWLNARAQISRRSLTGNVVRFKPTAQTQPAMASDPARALGRELRQLAPGRGLQSAALEIGPALRELCYLTTDAPPHIARDALIARLLPALGQLPEDLKLVAGAALSLHNDPAVRGTPYLGDRMFWCANRLMRDSRTVRRRFDEATYLLAQLLLATPPPAHPAAGELREQG